MPACVTVSGAASGAAEERERCNMYQISMSLPKDWEVTELTDDKSPAELRYVWDKQFGDMRLICVESADFFVLAVCPPELSWYYGVKVNSCRTEP